MKTSSGRREPADIQRWRGPRAFELRRVPAVALAVEAHTRARVRRVDETSVADVEAHVAQAVEEEQVAGPEPVEPDAEAVSELSDGGVGEPNAEVPVHVRDEARAVEAAPR